MTEFADMTKEQLEQVARELGLTVAGSGARGRVVKQDLLDALQIVLPPPESHTDRNLSPDIDTVKIRVINMVSPIWVTAGPMENQKFEPGGSYEIPASWWRILREMWTDEGEPYFTKEIEK